MDATNKENETRLASPIELRQRLSPFTKDESGIKFIGETINNKNIISRAGLYCLNILTNLIKQNVTDVYQRTHQRAFRGLSESDRKTASGAVILRAGLDGRFAPPAPGSSENDGKRKDFRTEVLDSGYTREQEILAKWAERDGCWSDYPETDQQKAGHVHLWEADGSESSIFTDKKQKAIYKLKDSSHYDDSVQELLDSTITHNAIFPETRYETKGYGQRELDETNKGFIFVLSQPFVKGRTPEDNEIKEHMESELGFVRYGNHYISSVNGLIVEDINPLNSLIIKDNEGRERLVVFDCDFKMKEGRMPGLDNIGIVNVDDLGPSGSLSDSYKTEPWDKVLGKSINARTANEVKSKIRKNLTFRGMAELPDGRIIMLKNPRKEFLDEDTVKSLNLPQNFIYSAKEAEIGFPYAFYEPEGYKIPDVQFNQNRVNRIKAEIFKTIPKVMTLYDFFRSPEHIGIGADWHSEKGKTERQRIVDELKHSGHISGLLQGKYVVALDRMNSDNVLISTPEKIQFMMFSSNSELLENGEKFSLSQMDRNRLIMGETLNKQGREIFFDIDRGRIEARTDQQRKLEMTNAEVHVNKRREAETKAAKQSFKKK